jgi:hypothetical protein
MPRIGSTLSVLTLLAACGEPVALPGTDLPQLMVDDNRLNFGNVEWGETAFRTLTVSNGGEKPMGIDRIELSEDEMEDNFALYLGRSVYCEGRPLPNTRNDSDTGMSDGGDASGSSTGSMLTSTLVIDPGCSYDFEVAMSPKSVGAIYASLRIHTKTETGDKPEYHADPDNAHATVILEGFTTKGSANIIVSPRTLDFAHPDLGDEVRKYVEFHNVGTGPLTIQPPTVDEECDDRFALDFARFADGALVLEAQTSTLMPVTYTSTTGPNAECEMTIVSDDPDTETSRVSLRGQIGTDPLCTPPSVNLVAPEPGIIHDSTDDLVLTLQISDADQPPTTLYCEVTSLFNLDEEGVAPELAECRPYAESGYTLVSIPASSLMVGTDVLKITVQDECGKEDHTTVSVLYGTDYPLQDDDGDGFADGPISDSDCDDEDSWVYPYAAEIHDGKDNDCDGVIDEGTDAYDDDDDGHSEIDGDCNDYDDAVYPGAPEQPDHKDNDCDGTVDDRTGLYDDDGDGFAETDNDCADNNPDVHPAAIEYCDGIDNNCNGLMDERDGCIDINGAPMIIGGIQMAETAIGSGESTVLSIEVYDPDGSEFTFAWQEDDRLAAAGHSGFDSVISQTVSWTAPDIETEGGETYTINVIVNDPDGHSDFAIGEITVFPEPVETNIGGYDPAEDGDSGGCGDDEDDDASSALILTPLLLLLGLRRRED